MTTVVHRAPTATRAAAAAGGPHLSVMLTRVGGLPAGVVDAVVPDVDALVAEIAALDDHLAELAPTLIALFFDLVPQLDDDVPLRRAVLSAKRAAANGAPPRWDDEMHDRLSRRIGAAAATPVARWVRACTHRVRLLATLDTELAEHRERALRRLLEALDVDEFMQSLALAAPDWLRYGKLRQRGVRSTRNVQTLYSYVTRAALKTSPFSGLTTVGTAGATGRGRVQTRTSATVGYLALLRLARDEATAPLLHYRVAPVRPGGRRYPDGLLLHSEFMSAEGTIWRQDRVVEADNALRWTGVLRPGPGGRLSYAEIVSAAGGAEPFRRFRRLLDSGIIQPVPAWRQGEPPLRALADLVADGVRTPPGPLAMEGVPERELRDAHEFGAGVGRLSTEQRLQAAGGIRRTAAGWAASGDDSQLPSGLIYEDRETDLALFDPRSVPAVRADLARLGARIRPFIFRSHVYDLLVAQFVDEFGAGGGCTDPLGFLMRMAVDGDANPPLDAAMAADLRTRAEPGERAWLPVGPTSAPPNAGVLFQLAAAGEDDIRAGRYRLVVNHFSSGTGGLFSRFAGLLGDGFRAELLRYVERCWPGVSRRQLVLWSDCNTVQAECAGVLPPLLMPGEVPAPDGITLDDTRLVHDPRTDTLSLYDRQGTTPIGLGYLGLIPQHLLQSYVRLLAVLADPWVNASQHSDYTMTKTQEFAAHLGDEVVPLEPVVDGRVVTRRRSWVVPVASVPRPPEGGGPEGGGNAEFALALARFRAAHGIPDEVFVHQLAGLAFPMSGVGKPMWVALSSPLSVGVLWQWLVPGTSHLRMVEVLPGRGQHPQRDRHGEARVTEQAVLMSWPRPERGSR